MLDILELKLKNSRSTSLSLVGLVKVSIDTDYGFSIDTPFSPSIDATTELSIDVPTSKLYRAGLTCSLG
ncbi:hypothetical protein IGI04_019576 [Brassica rapa subsp. trilocularis]|uniref:Late embryogenesis abundant protein LEA-2 subgroup domain-containing protein n=1 Tax=Brassica rapa subsp. trilocularis TaxID=1813537 RepID=A0ABQ7MG87_BRACM|nr:hypothetical protein IGI04_019576 [Brassica rapa subsp. trilocularis]